MNGVRAESDRIPIAYTRNATLRHYTSRNDASPGLLVLSWMTNPKSSSYVPREQATIGLGQSG